MKSSRRLPSSTAPILAADHLSVRRGETLILDAVSWRVEPGEHWVILGANGSGKTSLLAALTAYVTPSSGSVEVFGTTYGRGDWRELRKSVGLVSSSVRQMISDPTTALEVVASGKEATLNPWGRIPAADRTRATGILRQVEAAKLADRPWAVLSQGERQRVLIGRALMAAPRLLILDEPCAGLDPLANESFLLFVERLGHRRNAPALVLVTHHVEEITPVFTHALLLRAGRVEASGPIAETLTGATLTATFGAPVRLRRTTAGRYALTIHPAGRRVLQQKTPLAKPGRVRMVRRNQPLSLLESKHLCPSSSLVPSRSTPSKPPPKNTPTCSAAARPIPPSARASSPTRNSSASSAWISPRRTSPTSRAVTSTWKACSTPTVNPSAGRAST